MPVQSGYSARAGQRLACTTVAEDSELANPANHRLNEAADATCRNGSANRQRPDVRRATDAPGSPVRPTSTDRSPGLSPPDA
jgi:hypothetical protein